MAFVTATDRGPFGSVEELESQTAVSFREIKSIIGTRCLMCHSESTSDDVFSAAPNGVTFDTDEEIVRWAPRMKVRTYDLRTMPLANKSGISDEERLKIGAWVHQGAKTD